MSHILTPSPWALEFQHTDFGGVIHLLSHVQIFVTSWTTAHQASLSSNISQSLLKFVSSKLVMLSNHLTLCHPLFLLSLIFARIRVFTNESALHIKWPKYWSFSISPSNEYSGFNMISGWHKHLDHSIAHVGKVQLWNQRDEIKTGLFHQ